MASMKSLAIAAIIFFAVGLIVALVLKGIVLLFAIGRYRTYRDTLVHFRRGWNVSPPSPMIGAGVGLFIAACLATLIGILLAIIIVANVP